ncbi:MAG TPA: MFS transporter [Burkholderiaceae bacterium]|nr:MFS transporter [Burkholderiaceae bacterium]
MNNRFFAVLACAVGLGLSFGPMFLSTLPTLLKPMAAAYGWSRTEAASGIAVATLFLALGTPLVGRLVDRFGVRPVVIVSTTLFAATLFAFSRLQGSMALYLAAAAVLGIAAIGTTPLTYMTVLAKRYDARLGTAMGVAMLGMGLGYVAMPVLAARWSESMGWREAFVGLAALAAVGAVNAVFCVHEPRRALGAQAQAAAAIELPGMSLGEALRTRVLWLLSGSAFMVSLAVAGTAVHLVSLMSDRGYAMTDAATAGALMGVSVLSARFFTGILLDRLPVTGIAAVAFVAGGAGIVMLWSGTGGFVPFLAAFCMGVASGAEGDILPFACRRYFGMRAYGQIYGVVVAFYALGAVVGPVLLGLAFDRSGSYSTMLVVFAGLCLCAAMASLALGRPRYGRPELAETTPAFVSSARSHQV